MSVDADRSAVIHGDSSDRLVIGRTPDNDIAIDHPLISRHHARLEKWDSRWTITDLQSTNGTYVNGRRVATTIDLATGDVIDLGGSRLLLLDDGSFERRDYRGDRRIEARDLTISAGKRILLEGVSLTLLPSELVGLMGPSGAGKTTLMTTLNGYLPPTGGRVLFNGQDLYASFEHFRLGIGYVPQDDILHGELTVAEALYFTARLRFPADTSSHEIRQRIDRVLGQLGIAHIRDSRIGTMTHKVISGGERKRVVVAMELLNDPPALFLDEPTSGLSSEDALSVMQCLRALAQEGRTILLTIHQPSREVFRLLDNLAVVSRDLKNGQPARLVYYGPAYPEAVRYFNPDLSLPLEPQPEGVLRGLAERSTNEWLQRYQASALKKRFVDDRAGRGALRGATAPEAPRRPSSLGQTFILMRRGVALKARDLWNSSILLAQAPVIASLFVLIFAAATWKDGSPASLRQSGVATATVLFLMNIAAIWFGCSNAAREIVAEWAVFTRERMVGLQLSAYVGSKLGLLSFIGLTQCVLLLSIVKFGCRVDAPWLRLFTSLSLSMLVGTCLGLLISALARSSEVAISLVPLVILPMVVLGGMMQPVHEMDQPARALAQLVPSRWAFELAVHSEAQERTSIATAPDLADPYFPAKRRIPAATVIAVLMTQTCLLVAGTAAVLRSRDIHL